MNKDEALRKELRKEQAHIYAAFSALFGIGASVIISSLSEVSIVYLMPAWTFSGFISGYIFWRIIGGESKTAAFFTGLLAGLFSMILAPLLFFSVFLLFRDALSFNAIDVLFWLVFMSFIMGIPMISWFVVPLSIAVAFIFRRKIRKQTAPANKYEQR
ncbi:MAG: hypothetical protein LBO72_00535 [Helicobacteraceae bacterium]|jgi:hypothetical protein|nr:hypothetical protein [Helicobacteraceae bacterium]